MCSILIRRQTTFGVGATLISWLIKMIGELGKLLCITLCVCMCALYSVSASADMSFLRSLNVLFSPFDNYNEWFCFMFCLSQVSSTIRFIGRKQRLERR